MLNWYPSCTCHKGAELRSGCSIFNEKFLLSGNNLNPKVIASIDNLAGAAIGFPIPISIYFGLFFILIESGVAECWVVSWNVLVFYLSFLAMFSVYNKHDLITAYYNLKSQYIIWKEGRILTDVAASNALGC